MASYPATSRGGNVNFLEISGLTNRVVMTKMQTSLTKGLCDGTKYDFEE